MKKIGVIIQARMGSTRLPGKVLLKITEEKTMLEYMVERVAKSRKVDKIIIATSSNQSDDSIHDFCKSKNIDCFRGDENDVLARYYLCAKENNLDIIVRLTADCPLIDHEIIDLCIENYLNNDFDYYANACPPKLSKYPDGTDVEVFNFNLLGETYKNAKDKHDREHVTFYMWKYDNGYKTGILDSKFNLSNLRYTVDYKEDLEVVRFIAKKISDCNLRGSIDEVAKILHDNPEIIKKNSGYYQGIGWKK